MTAPPQPVPPEALELLKVHRATFHAAIQFADATRHPVPTDTRAWSQILVSQLTGILGRAREKGDDFTDGSDVKAANLWQAIDTPRFNGVLKSGRKGERGSLQCLDGMPHLFFVLWDNEPGGGADRCRVWVVRPGCDGEFRAMCEEWYRQRDAGTIRSHNFQLHPPRNPDSNVIRNKCGNLEYPLLFCAVWSGTDYHVRVFNPDVLQAGACRRI